MICKIRICCIFLSICFASSLTLTEDLAGEEYIQGRDLEETCKAGDQGPPNPVTKLNVTDVKDKSANITFLSGNDCKFNQTFLVQGEVKGKLENFSRLGDVANDTGGIEISIVVEDLAEFTPYNVTVISINENGSTPSGLYVGFATSGAPKPDPNYNLTTSYTPRLGDHVTLSIVALGKPKFTWKLNGSSIPSRDNDTSSEVNIEKVKVKDFGDYVLKMTNDFGSQVVHFSLIATGPPQPVSDVNVSDLNTSRADINFITGYNYNDTQSFLIMSYNNSQSEVLQRCADATSGHGGELFTCHVNNLTEETVYTISVVSSNRNGNSSTNFFVFITYGEPRPDPNYNDTYVFKPRLENRLTLTMHAKGIPIPTYTWKHGENIVHSTDHNYTSSVEIENVTVDAFGDFTLTMTNKAGTYTHVYSILADGVPAPVTNLKVTYVSTASANLSFVTGYDYNDTQTFIALNNQGGITTELKRLNDTLHDKGGKNLEVLLDSLSPMTSYNITIVAENSRGSDLSTAPAVNFQTYGAPVPDPNNPDKTVFTPRLHSVVKLEFHALGNPLPTFEWYKSGKQLNSTGSGNKTELNIADFGLEDFGTYLLVMKNSWGEANETFNVTQDGPPDPVLELTSGKVTYNSVELSWKPGYNYGSAQTFDIYGVINNGKNTTLQHGIADDTDGGTTAKNQSRTLTCLESSSSYTINVGSSNQRGSAASSNTITFQTPEHPITTLKFAIVIAAYVISGIGLIVIVVLVIFAVIKWRQRKNSYESLQD